MKRKNVYVALLIGLVLLVLTACGGNSPTEPEEPNTPTKPTNPTNPNNPTTPTFPSNPTNPSNPPAGDLEFSGTVTPPRGGNLSGTVVLVCFLLEDNSCSNDEQESQVVNVSRNGTFKATVAEGSYVIFAVKDVNQSGEIDDGDYIGGVFAGDSLAVLEPPQDDLEIALAIYQDDTGNNPPSGGGGEGGELSGIVSIGGANESVQGSVVLACFINENNECENDSPNTTGVEITATGAQAPFSIPEVAAGDYGVFAFKDVNDDQTIGTGDLFGCYSTGGQGCNIATPPQTNIAIEMTEITANNVQALRLGSSLKSTSLSRASSSYTDIDKKFARWLNRPSQ